MKKKDILQFISEANIVHNNKYDYSKIEYINSDTKVTIICPEHGEFKQTPAKHLIGRGCPICGREKLSQKLRSTLENFVQKANQKHNNKYDYSKTEYVNKNTKVCIICPEHGEFWQTPANHLKGEKCPFCEGSKLEKHIYNLLTKKGIHFIKEQKFEWLVNKNKLSIDYYIPSHKIAIECQGLQHFETIEYFGGVEKLKRTQENDKIKKQLCEKHGIRVVYYSNLNIKFPYEVKNNEDITNFIDNL